ncbi:MAG: hypothetical protein ABEH64_02265 [Salinirussus sp.]
MGDDQPTHRNGTAELRDTAPIGTTALASQRAAIYMRSYDHQWGYDVDIAITDLSGDLMHQARYYVLPGQARSESPDLPAGEYEVRVVLDNSTEQRVECRIDESPDNTVMIEMGNGAMAVSNGLRL